ncbi:uncharacterized protein V6R79_015317 [Siganus canaliculatus]
MKVPRALCVFAQFVQLKQCRRSRAHQVTGRFPSSCCCSSEDRDAYIINPLHFGLTQVSEPRYQRQPKRFQRGVVCSVLHLRHYCCLAATSGLHKCNFRGLGLNFPKMSFIQQKICVTSDLLEGRSGAEFSYEQQQMLQMLLHTAAHPWTELSEGKLTGAREESSTEIWQSAFSCKTRVRERASRTKTRRKKQQQQQQKTRLRLRDTSVDSNLQLTSRATCSGLFGLLLIFRPALCTLQKLTGGEQTDVIGVVCVRDSS